MFCIMRLNHLSLCLIHKNKMKNKKILLIFFLIALIVSVLILVYLFKNKNNDSIQVGFYKNCNQISDANAPILPSSILNDKNDLHLLHALKNGISKPIISNYEFDSTILILKNKSILIELKDNNLYHLKSLNHSHPYLVPEAVDMLNEIAVKFQKRLKEKKLPQYCFFLTSLLRTVETQSILSKRNRNATAHTAHYYGTTVDISYKHFYRLDNDSIEPSWEAIQELTKTLIEMREKCKILAKRERKQSCYHITVVTCKPSFNFGN